MKQSNPYRKNALERIARTPELAAVRCLRHVHWEKCSDFWQWLEAAPIENILSLSDDLQLSELRLGSYHEAGHLVTGWLMHMELVSATLVPNTDPFAPATGGIIFDMYSPDEMEESFYCAWRYIAYLMAGGMADSKSPYWDGTPTFYGDVYQAIFFAQTMAPDFNSQQNLIDLGLAGAFQIMKNPTIWKAVEKLANMLLLEGDLRPSDVNDTIHRIVRQSPNRPSIINTIDVLEEAYIKNPNAYEENNSLFLTSMSPYLTGCFDFPDKLLQLTRLPMHPGLIQLFEIGIP